MSTANKNLSNFKPENYPGIKDLRIAIIVSEWNEEITHAMFDGTRNTLIKNGVVPDQIVVNYVPGSFELTAGARMAAETGTFDVVICLGCVIRGETPHFDYICTGVTYGITQLNVQYSIPFIFGVLTTENFQQAKDRAGGKFGNKGDEAAITALKMATLLKRSSDRN